MKYLHIMANNIY